MDYLSSDLLAGVAHGFSTRASPADLTVFAGRPLVLVKQVHSAQVVIVRSSPGWTEDAVPEADALVTDSADFAIGVVTADCAPVLLSDMHAGIIGAAHAGWRGAFAGVVENTVEAMCAIGAERGSLAASIGPTIAQCNYEVDEAFGERIGHENARYFAPGKPGHFYFDLPAFVKDRLHDAGVRQIDDLACDTYADEARFHSYRRATHREEDTKGRQISAIALPYNS